MGQISSLAAPFAPQIQPLIAKRAAPVLPDTGLANQGYAQKVSAALPAERARPPILPANRSEAMLKGHLPSHAALPLRPEAGDISEIERLTEVDGIRLDGIPYLRDGAVLVDDLPQAEPAPAVKTKNAAPCLAFFATPAPLHAEAMMQSKPDQMRTEQAERAYREARALSGAQPEPVLRPETPGPDKAASDMPVSDSHSPGPPAKDAAPGCDTRA